MLRYRTFSLFINITNFIKMRNFFSKILATILAFLGFSSCAETVIGGHHDSDVVCMYGVPNAEFRISGKVTDESQKQPIEDVQVSIGRYEDDFVKTYTDEKGEYSIVENGFPLDSISVEATDINGIYESQSVKIKVEYKGGDNAWNRGTATAKVDFVLTKKAENDD